MKILSPFALATASFITLLNVSPSFSQQFSSAPRKLIRVDARQLTPATLNQFLRRGFDLAEANPVDKSFDVIAKAEDLQALAGMGISYQTLHDNLEAMAQELRAHGYLDHFHDYLATRVEIEIAQAEHPELVKVVDIGDTWEKTQGLADRDIWAVKISDNVEVEEDEPEVLIMALHHAREIITPEIALDFIHHLLENYGSDPYVTYLVNQRQIWVIPVVNPDGLDYVFTADLWWRKNRRDNTDGSYGVDLNRNYGFQWGYDDEGSSPLGYAETYRGTAAFSEPEIVAVRDFVTAHRFRAAFSYHSYGNLLIYPWGYISEHTPDHASFVALADSIVTYNRYFAGLGTETVQYSVNGDSDDWF